MPTISEGCVDEETAVSDEWELEPVIDSVLAANPGQVETYRGGKEGLLPFLETKSVIRPTRFALESAQLQPEYYRCWQGLRKNFDPGRS